MQRRITAGICAGLLLCTVTGCGEAIDPIESGSEIVLNVPDTTAIVTTTAAAPRQERPHWNDHVQTDAETEQVLIEGVPHETQFTEHLTACESIAACCMLQYYGIDMSVDEFLDGYLPISDYPVKDRDGELHAESAWDSFIGDPNKGDGFGCYSTAIRRGVNKICKDLVFAMEHVPLNTLCEEYVAKGEPVVIWGTINMQPAFDAFKWLTPSGDWFTFVSPEHALLLIGFDAQKYYFSDSMQEAAVTGYDKQLVEQAYEALGEQCVLVNQSKLQNVPNYWRIMDTDTEDD